MSIGLKETPIGQNLRDRPKLLAFLMLFALVTVIVYHVTLAISVRHAHWHYFIFFEMSLALLACLVFGMVGTETGLGSCLGLRSSTVQGCRFWLKSTLIVGLGLLVVVTIAFGVWLLIVGFRIPTYAKPIVYHIQIWPWFVTLCFVAPLMEEVVYRLVLCPPLTALIGPWPTVVVVGTIFALAHVIGGRVAPENVVGGYLLCWAFLKSGSIAVPIIWHFVGNLCAFGTHVGIYYFEL